MGNRPIPLVIRTGIHAQYSDLMRYPTFPADFSTTQILGGHVTSWNQGLCSNDLGRQRRETLGTRLHFVMPIQCARNLIMRLHWTTLRLWSKRCLSFSKFWSPSKVNIHWKEVSLALNECKDAIDQNTYFEVRCTSSIVDCLEIGNSWTISKSMQTILKGDNSHVCGPSVPFLTPSNMVRIVWQRVKEKTEKIFRVPAGKWAYDLGNASWWARSSYKLCPAKTVGSTK